MNYRIGVDLGGSKIEIAGLGPDGSLVGRKRVRTPQGYDATIAAIAELVAGFEADVGPAAGIGVGIPGTICPVTGLVKNANSRQLNGNAFDRDIAAAIGRTVRIANDANCFAMSEAMDGAGAGTHCVFGVILGTGCGGGIVVGGKIHAGRHGIAGEWGHTPLPWPRDDELPLRSCWCGQRGCLEAYLCGPALASEVDGAEACDARLVFSRATAGDAMAAHALDLHLGRLARGLAMVVNILDPDVIVLGGGLSNMMHLYEKLPDLIKPFVIGGNFSTPIRPNMHGDSSGVRGAAWLWNEG